MNDNKTQISQLNPDELASSLAFATHLMQQNLPQAAQLGFPTQLPKGELNQGFQGFDNTSGPIPGFSTPAITPVPEEKQEESEAKDVENLGKVKGMIEQLANDLRGEMDSKVAKEIEGIKALIKETTGSEKTEQVNENKG